MVHVYKNVFVIHGQECFMAAAACSSRIPRTKERACKKPTLVLYRWTPLHFPSWSTHNNSSSSSQMKCASNKTAQICTWWMAYSFIHRVSIFAIRNSARMYCQMAVIPSSKLPWSEVFVCAHRSSYHLHPLIHQDGPNWCARIKTKLLKFVPRFWLLRLLLSMPMLCVRLWRIWLVQIK